MPAREAFALGRTLVVPSRAESLPYIVLEAAGAQVPMVATDVGGIGEIFGPYRDRLVACDDPLALAMAMERASRSSTATMRREAEELAAFVATRFSHRHHVRRRDRRLPGRDRPAHHRRRPQHLLSHPSTGCPPVS